MAPTAPLLIHSAHTVLTSAVHSRVNCITHAHVQTPRAYSHEATFMPSPSPCGFRAALRSAPALERYGGVSDEFRAGGSSEAHSGTVAGCAEGFLAFSRTSAPHVSLCPSHCPSLEAEGARTAGERDISSVGQVR